MDNGSRSQRHCRGDGSRILLFVLVSGVLIALMNPALATERVDIPEDAPGGPFYARLEPDGAPHTDEWAAIVFYREPECVPDGFNLLNFFDFPRAFGCGLTVEGFEIWENGPGQDPAPRQTQLRDDGPVPVWFVSWEELQAAMADGVVTITDLENLDSLITGEASFFKETLHPREGAQHVNIQMNASGTLSDGRTFQLRYTGVEGTPNETKDATIIFR